MNYTLGVILKDQKNYQAAEEQMGKFISLYPDDWMVDDAMFEMAVCQIEQGKPDKAQATLESLLQKFPLTSAYQAKRVLENLKKGYKTMDQVYSH
jgi:TolA-binding protein